MRTTITGVFGKAPLVTHALDDGETWRELGFDQPNRTFTHDEAATPLCDICQRPLKSLGRHRET